MLEGKEEEKEEGGAKKDGKDVSWLEKDSLNKMKEIEEEEKNESKVRKVQSIRSTNNGNQYPNYSLKIAEQPEMVADLYANQQNFSSFAKK